jgi:hypothetical protein
MGTFHDHAAVMTMNLYAPFSFSSPKVFVRAKAVCLE